MMIRLQGFLLRWLPGWHLVSVHAVASYHRWDERIQLVRLAWARRRLERLDRLERPGCRPRDGPA